MTTKKWVNRFAPIYRPNSNMDAKPLKLSVKIMDLFERAVVQATGQKRDPYEEVGYVTADGVISGWMYAADLEDYVENYPHDCVVIDNQTPDPNDAEQYFIFNGVKQVNACGELCVAFVLGVSLHQLLENWQLRLPSFWQRVFVGGKLRGTGSSELTEMFNIYNRESQQLRTVMYQPHMNRSRYTIQGLQNLLKTGSVIASVNIDNKTLQLRGSGLLHWVAVTKVIAERNGLGSVEMYNPAMNRIEWYSWQEFISSAREPYGAYIPKL
jgi:hypothetical protein